MLSPEDLYVVAPEVPQLDSPVMIRLLDGFIDAGSVGQIVRNHLLETLDHSTLVSFDADQLHDYRARRPTMLFRQDHWESYDQPELVVHAMKDAVGTPFLLLTGPEPDAQWDRFVAAVEQLVTRFGVRLTVGLNGIPMGVPHTRPISLTVHQTRPGLIEGYAPWLETVQVPASIGNLLEFRLGQQGHDAAGFAIHVPHYVAQADYPAAAATALDAIARATGLALPTTELRAAADEMRSAIDEQVRQSSEVAAVVAALEDQYDTVMTARSDNLLGDSSRPLPSADELGAELERFLAEQIRKDPES